MPVVTEAPVKGYAHCVNPRCSGTTQQEVDAVKVVTERTYRDVGSNLSGTENSHETFRFADPAERACPGCGGLRDLTDQRRPVYQPLTASLTGAPPGGFPQDGLLNVDQFDPGKDPRVDALSEKVEEQSAQIARLLEALEKKDES